VLGVDALVRVVLVMVDSLEVLGVTFAAVLFVLPERLQLQAIV